MRSTMQPLVLAALLLSCGVRAVEAAAANKTQHILNGNTVIPSGISRRVLAPRSGAATAPTDFGLPGTQIAIDAWGRGKLTPTVAHHEPGIPRHATSPQRPLCSVSQSAFLASVSVCNLPLMRSALLNVPCMALDAPYCSQVNPCCKPSSSAPPLRAHFSQSLAATAPCLTPSMTFLGT
jgi:hypothetical protein